MQCKFLFYEGTKELYDQQIPRQPDYYNLKWLESKSYFNIRAVGH